MTTEVRIAAKTTRRRSRRAPVAAPSLADEAIAAIVQSDHSDPFAVLGPHQISPGEWEIRAMIPRALAVEVLDADGASVLAPMERRNDAGFFVATVKSEERPWYRLRFETPHGTFVRYDPYSFGPILDDESLASVGDVGSEAPYHVLGAHCRTVGSVDGFLFTVWAPSARRVNLIGDFNDWDGRAHPMRLRYPSGIWELFVPELPPGTRYKFEVKGPDGQLLPHRADPVAFESERPPATGSVVRGLKDPVWADSGWMEERAARNYRKSPMTIYECHLASWARVHEEGNRYLTYGELAERLIPYVKDLGFTHIELLPITEYPFDGSWGYQPVSLYAPTSRFGSPDDFADFVQAAHDAGIGVILDWVPGHFPNDPHGLGFFDGTHLYEHADPRQGFHQDWGTFIYNYGRREVAAFLIANARFWLEHYHLDGLRVDAVASMLYLDYSRNPGEWVPNRYGGNENLEAIEFLRRMNEAAYRFSPGAFTIAEESTAWPGVSHPTYTGGLGFGFKWNMGWMNDTLRYIGKDPIHRRYHHHDITFGLVYAFSENFMLPLSHDEVVHGKGSLLGRMPGDQWQRFANLRAYFGFMWGHPGKKLLFMGGEFAQQREWNHDQSLDWHLLDDRFHRGVQSLMRDLNMIYRSVPALHERDTEASGFQWLVADDAENSVIAWARRGENESEVAVVVCNFTPVPHESYRIGVPLPGLYQEVLNTDSEIYGGTNMGNLGGVEAVATESHGQPWSIELTLPPLATVFLHRAPSVS
jgi:1,4-alpha-glucan branching enzyme